jgi:hypothetical protein
VLHEFWTQYDPRQSRVHAFFEGHDDVVFFSPHIEKRLPEGFRLFTYRCEGKPRVMDVFTEITKRAPDIRLTLFFVDKDLDDILGAPWPTDPRVFVTDVYSIENYLVSTQVLRRLLRDSIRLTGVSFNEDVIIAQFESQLRSFQERMLVLMAWILVIRRNGGRPNLSNLDLGAMWRISDDGQTCYVTGSRVHTLSRSTGVTLPRDSTRRLREALRELRRMPAKRIVRGKFEGWFFVEFWKRLIAQLRTLAAEEHGKVNIKIALTHTSLVTTLASYVDTPRPLDLFLQAHLAGSVPLSSLLVRPKMKWWRRLFGTS